MEIYLTIMFKREDKTNTCSGVLYELFSHQPPYTKQSHPGHLKREGQPMWRGREEDAGKEERWGGLKSVPCAGSQPSLPTRMSVLVKCLGLSHHGGKTKGLGEGSHTFLSQWFCACCQPCVSVSLDEGPQATVTWLPNQLAHLQLLTVWGLTDFPNTSEKETTAHLSQRVTLLDVNSCTTGPPAMPSWPSPWDLQKMPILNVPRPQDRLN